MDSRKRVPKRHTLLSDKDFAETPPEIPICNGL